MVFSQFYCNLSKEKAAGNVTEKDQIIVKHPGLLLERVLGKTKRQSSEW